MTSQPLYLIDASSARIADLSVALTDDLYSGTICLAATSPELKHLFEEFEEMVEGQVFNLADEIEEKIAAFSLRAVFADGVVAPVEELQVFPNTKRVSFKVRQASSVAK